VSDLAFHFSDPFLFAERVGRPGRGEGEVKPVLDKWVYVYDHTMLLLHELFVDSRRGIWLASDEDLASVRDQRRGPQHAEESEFLSSFALPLQPYGLSNYRVLVSQVRLPLEVGQTFAGAVAKHIPELFEWRYQPAANADIDEVLAALEVSLAHLPNPAYDPEDPPNPDLILLGAEDFHKQRELPAVVGYDPLEIGRWLHGRYEKRWNAHLKAHVRPSSVAKKKATQLEFLSTQLASLLLHNDALLSDVDDDIEGPPLSFKGRYVREALELLDSPLSYDTVTREVSPRRLLGMLQFVGQRSLARKESQVHVERAARALVDWLENDLMLLTEEAFLSREHPFAESSEPLDGEPAFWLWHYAAMTDRLSESLTGANYYKRQVESFGESRYYSDSLKQGKHPHFLNAYILSEIEKPVGQTVFKNTRFASKSVMSIFKEALIPVIAGTEIEKTSDHLALEQRVRTWAQKLLGEGSDAIAAGSGPTRETLFREGSRVKKLKFESLQLDPRIKKIKEFLGEDAVGDQKVSAALSKVALGFDVVNLALSLKALDAKLKLEPDAVWGRSTLDSAFTTLSTSMSLFKLVSGDTLEHATKDRLNALSAISSAYYMVTSGLDAVAASGINDDDAAFGNWVASFGNGVALYGAYLILIESSLGGPVAFVGGLIASIAYIFVSIVKDSHLETFVKHCHWGTDASTTSEARPGWAEKALGRWAGDYQTQLLSMQRLCSAFTVTVEGGSLFNGGAVIVTLGQLTLESRLEVIWDAEANFGVERRRLTRSRPLEGESLHDSLGRHEGRVVLRLPFPADIRHELRDAVSIRDISVRIRLDAFGDGKVMIPGPAQGEQGALLYPLMSKGKWINETGFFGWPTAQSSEA